MILHCDLNCNHNVINYIGLHDDGIFIASFHWYSIDQEYIVMGLPNSLVLCT